MKDSVFDLIESETKRQREGLELIPSENYVSANVLGSTSICSASPSIVSA